MSVALWIAGVILALAWFSRIVDAGLGMPSVANIADEKWSSVLPEWPKVSIIVPALNEEETIVESLTRLLNLDYPNYEVIAVNDRSTDRTGARMDAVAALPEAHGRLQVIHVTELPSGWLGKVNAMQRAADSSSGDWLLFTDADILFRPDTLKRALLYIESEPADHLVLLPYLVMKTIGERMMIAFFQTMFVFGHRPWKVADPKAMDHIGVGAFNLIRRSVYSAIGGHHRLCMEVVDDMKLGKLVKQAGFRQRNVFGIDPLAEASSRGLISLRWAASRSLGQGASALRELAAHPRAQRVITAYVISGGWAKPPHDIDGTVKETTLRMMEKAASKATFLSATKPSWHTFKRPVLLWLEAVEAANVKDIDSAEQLALAAYQAGEM